MGSELLVQELSIQLWYYLKIINSAKGYSFKGRQWNNETEWRFNNTYSDKETDGGPRHGGSVENKLFRRGCWENQLVTDDAEPQHPLEKLGIVVCACRCWENQLVTKTPTLPHTICKINLKWTTDLNGKRKIGSI